MRTLRIGSLILVVAALLAVSVVASGCGTSDGIWNGNASVQTIHGPVQGFKYEDTYFWKAIPYAKPPVGELRWKAPRDPEPWSEPLEAKEFCSQCPQPTITDLFSGTTSITGVEDCLYLNVWRPQSNEGDLPVYFWIHGGGNSVGTASYDGYDGNDIARQSEMVVVTANYRLGPLGWFTHPALRGGQAGDELDDSGNYGTLDLIKALEWVRDNIQAFGGNPENVTIAGESAGAINVFSLLISERAQGLFHRAIAQSGMPVATSVAVGEESAEEVIVNLMVNDGTAPNTQAARAFLDQQPNEETEAYLRSKTPAQLLAGYESTGFGMISFPFNFKEGTVLPGTGFDVLETGEYPNKVPIILGSNKEETKLFLFMDPAFEGEDELYQEVTTATSDLWKAAGVDEVARQLRSHSDQPGVYVYQFLWGAQDDAGQSVIPGTWGFDLGACHALDVPFFFGNDFFLDPLLSPAVFTDENRPGREALSDAMMAYVAHFARTGDPNLPDGGLPEWKPWINVDGEPKCILLDADLEATDIAMSNIELTKSSVIAETDPEVLEFIDSLDAQFILQFTDLE
jgi:para-nitrobenzyl esterase